MTRLMFLILILAAGAAAAGEAVYKWKDANGVVHYSDAPPANQESVQVKVDMASTPDAVSTGDSTDNPAADADGTAKETAAKQAEAPPPDNKANCARARANLEIFETMRNPIMDRDGDGKVETLDDTARQEEIAKAQAQILELCG